MIKARWLLTITLVFLALTYYGVRGPMRHLQPGASGDFRVLYAGAGAWVDAADPYDAEGLRNILVHRGHPPLEPDSLGPQITTPSAFLVLSPAAVLGWPAAKWGWLILNTLLVFAVVECVRRIAWLNWTQHRCWLLLAGGMGSAAVHSGVHNGQVAVLGTAMIAFAVLQAQRRGLWPWVKGVSLGLGIALKPTLAGLFALDLIAARRWRALLACLVTAAAVALLAVLWLDHGGSAWRATWANTLEAFFAGGDGDLRGEGTARFSMIHLDMIPLSFGAQPQITRRAVMVVCSFTGLLLAVLAWRRGRMRPEHRDEPETRLLSLSIISILTLLVIYHRIYDATVLIFPLALALRLWPTRRIAAGLLIAGCAVFAVPGPVMLAVFFKRGWLPEAWLGHAGWNGLVMCHQVWALLVMLGVLAYLTALRPADDKAGRTPAESADIEGNA